MKKKIITLALAVVMCLSVITSVTATDTLNRVASTIPGTDIEYNYVENVTVQIPGTDVTFELQKVAETVYVDYDEDSDFPIYTFLFYEKDGIAKVNQSGEWLLCSAYAYAEEAGDGMWFDINDGKTFSHFAWCTPDEDPDEEAAKSPWSFSETSILLDNSCKHNYDASIDTPIATIVFMFSNGTYDITPKKFSEKKNIQDFAFVEESFYTIIDGANSVVNENALTIKADGDFDKFTGVKVDGEFVDSSNYTATEGSTIIEFKADYLKTLDAGEHTVSVVFTDGEATTKFEIKEDKDTNTTDKNENDDNLVTDVEIPNTDYNTSVTPVFVAMAISGMALIGLKKKSK